MPDPMLIAVGGSGQHTVLAYLRLARLCNFKPARIITLDSDLAKGKDEPSTAELISTQTSIGFERPIPYETVKPLPEISGLHDETYESLVSPSPGSLEEELFQSLFTPQQRAVEVTTGFHGHPAVAGSTFRMAMAEGSERISEHVGRWFDERGEQRVVVVGSTFGGTGSGVMPVVTQHIRNMEQAKHVRLRLGGVIQMCWFNLGLSDDVAGDDDLADVTKNVLDRNSSCLVEYYRENFDKIFDYAYLVGLDVPARRRQAGTDRQPEHPHAVNLMSGYMAYKLLHGSWDSGSSGLVGVQTPDTRLERQIRLPFGQSRADRPLARHIEATCAQVAIGRAILNILAAGKPSPLEVVEPYPPFIRLLVKRTRGIYGRPVRRTGQADLVQPYSAWEGQLKMQEEALGWLADMRDASEELAKFPMKLVANRVDVDQLYTQERHLPGEFYKAFRTVLKRMTPEDLGDPEDEVELIVRRGFYALRRELEGYLEETRLKGDQ